MITLWSSSSLFTGVMPKRFRLAYCLLMLLMHMTTSHRNSSLLSLKL